MHKAAGHVQERQTEIALESVHSRGQIRMCMPLYVCVCVCEDTRLPMFVHALSDSFIHVTCVCHLCRFYLLESQSVARVGAAQSLSSRLSGTAQGGAYGGEP